MIRRLLKDESGQTMLEYIVIVVFVVIMAIVGFRLVKGIVHRSVQRASTSIEQ
jgi:Flp pilus assembly pilin Flp